VERRRAGPAAYLDGPRGSSRESQAGLDDDDGDDKRPHLKGEQRRGGEKRRESWEYGRYCTVRG